jgi:hypothetical protein
MWAPVASVERWVCEEVLDKSQTKGRKLNVLRLKHCQGKDSCLSTGVYEQDFFMYGAVVSRLSQVLEAVASLRH